jgi:hypothetical protein
MKSIVEYGRTANMGNFESLRIAKSLEVTAKTQEELDEACDLAYDHCRTWVEKKILHEMKNKRPERKSNC